MALGKAMRRLCLLLSLLRDVSRSCDADISYCISRETGSDRPKSATWLPTAFSTGARGPRGRGTFNRQRSRIHVKRS